MFLGRAAGLAAGLAGGGALASGIGPLVASGGTDEGDARILNFLLAVEYAQATLYEEAGRRSALRGELHEYATVARAHELEHIALLRGTLGPKTKPPPSFDFSDSASDRDRFVRAALELEETAAAAYIGQAANLPRGVVSDVGRICSVEARHTAWIRDIAGELPAPRAADPGRKPADVMAVLRRYGYQEG